jgi:hypothetical protein
MSWRRRSHPKETCLLHYTQKADYVVSMHGPITRTAGRLAVFWRDFACVLCTVYCMAWEVYSASTWISRSTCQGAQQLAAGLGKCLSLVGNRLGSGLLRSGPRARE